MSQPQEPEQPRGRIRSLGIVPGVLLPGSLNAITDVAGVRVGHVTFVEGEGIRIGVTAIMPHSDNLFQSRVPIGLAVGNEFGKPTGATQLVELGELETPLVLTNTLSCCPLHQELCAKIAKNACHYSAKSFASASRTAYCVC